MTRQCPLYWGATDQGRRRIGTADYEISIDGTEILLSYEIDDPEIKAILFPRASLGDYGSDYEISTDGTEIMFFGEYNLDPCPPAP